MTLKPRAVVVHRRSELDELVDTHGTRGAAEFYLAARGRDLAGVQGRHDQLGKALAAITTALPDGWRRAEVERADLDRFLFTPEDIVIAVGQDGLVANVAKYLAGQPVVGVDPTAGAAGPALMRFVPDAAARLLRAGHVERWVADQLTMVEARSDDGQQLRALNEIFVGHASHQSARYVLWAPAAGQGDQGASERQNSSGVIVGTGTGSTGWLASLAHDRPGSVDLPTPTSPGLAWFVREAWPSAWTGVQLTAGMLGRRAQLRLVVESDRLVVFGDGMEHDRIVVGWGQEISIGIADGALRLVRPTP